MGAEAARTLVAAQMRPPFSHTMGVADKLSIYVFLEKELLVHGGHHVLNSHTIV